MTDLLVSNGRLAIYRTIENQTDEDVLVDALSCTTKLYLISDELLCITLVDRITDKRNGQWSLIFIDAKTHSNYCFSAFRFLFRTASHYSSSARVVHFIQNKSINGNYFHLQSCTSYHFLLDVQFFTHFPIINLWPITSLENIDFYLTAQ